MKNSMNHKQRVELDQRPPKFAGRVRSTFEYASNCPLFSQLTHIICSLNRDELKRCQGCPKSDKCESYQFSLRS